ncbi:hypothetical protein V5799_017526 [Amblyomma americanum]|uniref:Calpain catalytic domain-containing protein n=1 Tax=Amblyomma americanum TaxID=6943 RepID=A0AAQ4F200_AMBAM
MFSRVLCVHGWPRFANDHWTSWCRLAGDRWFVSCLGVLATCRGLFYRVVPADQGFSDADEYAGLFRFRLWWCGDWKEVIIDDRLPTVNGKLVFVQSSHGSLFWAALLEKAYAK